MKKSAKPNVSPLEIEVENKLRDGYLFSIAFKDRPIKFGPIVQLPYLENDTLAGKQTGSALTMKPD